MTKQYLLDDTLAQKIAKATGALLILQWAYDDTVRQHWNATDCNRCQNTHQLHCWIMIVVKDDEPRSSIELMHDAEAACKGSHYLSVTIFRRKKALLKLKNNHGDFAIVYRLGCPLYNADEKTFPQPGYARDNKKQDSIKPLRTAHY